MDGGRSWLEWSPHIQIKSTTSFIYHCLLMRNFRLTNFRITSKVQVTSASRGDSTLLLCVLPPCLFFISFLAVWTSLYSSCSRNPASETLEAATGWWRWSNKPELVTLCLGLDKANKRGTASQREGCYQLHREGETSCWHHLFSVLPSQPCHILLNTKSSPTSMPCLLEREPAATRNTDSY